MLHENWKYTSCLDNYYYMIARIKLLVIYNSQNKMLQCKRTQKCFSILMISPIFRAQWFFHCSELWNLTEEWKVERCGWSNIAYSQTEFLPFFVWHSAKMVFENSSIINHYFLQYIGVLLHVDVNIHDMNLIENVCLHNNQ